ncbi:protein of unknown function [Spirosomataceae bacterium TFI 002]|nr:protein of unknown function [Spirosomataceae bacterium TFI 002]
MKEYGSNIQKLVEHIVSVPDKATRTKHAHILVELMRQIHPQMREGIDYSKKLWDDLYIMANFDLDVDSPFPPPPKEILGRKPNRIPYTQKHLRYRFYGRNIELLVAKAIATESFDERKAFVSYLVRLMQDFFLNWNKDTIEVENCLQQILQMSENQLQKEVDSLRKDGLIEGANPKDRNKGTSRQPAFRGNDRPYRNNRNNRNNNNNRNRNSRFTKKNNNNRKRT